jgi:ABC-type sugar transport system permease subunit
MRGIACFGPLPCPALSAVASAVLWTWIFNTGWLAECDVHYVGLPKIRGWKSGVGLADQILIVWCGRGDDYFLAGRRAFRSSYEAAKIDGS